MTKNVPVNTSHVCFQHNFVNNGIPWLGKTICEKRYFHIITSWSRNHIIKFTTEPRSLVGLVEGEFVVAKLTQITLIPIRKWTESFELWWKETRNLDKIKKKILFANEQQSLIYSCVNILGSGGAYMRQSTGSSWVPFMAFRRSMPTYFLNLCHWCVNWTLFRPDWLAISFGWIAVLPGQIFWHKRIAVLPRWIDFSAWVDYYYVRVDYTHFRPGGIIIRLCGVINPLGEIVIRPGGLLLSNPLGGNSNYMLYSARVEYAVIRPGGIQKLPGWISISISGICLSHVQIS